jgi:hypothetical protein
LSPATSSPNPGISERELYNIRVVKAGFVNFNGGDGADYQLQPSSKHHEGGTDAKDLGADIDVVDSARNFTK